MADMGMFHALGQNDDPNDPNSRHNVAPPQYRTQPAPPPSGYQQAGAPPFTGPPQHSPYGLPPQPSPYQQQSPYGAPPPSTSPYSPPQQQNAYGPPQQQHGGYDPVGGLAQQMSQVDLMSQQVGTVSKASKKKGRAYHQLDQAPDSMGGGSNMPPFSPNVGESMQPGFLHHQQPMASPMTPGGSQFPMQAGPNFMPQQPVDAAGYHGAPGGTGVSSTGGKIDPLAIPSIPAARDRAIQHFRTTVYPTNGRQPLPNAASDFVAIDQQNASPRICRLTLNAVPTTAEVLNMTHLPLALQIQPLAKLKAEEEPIPVLDFGEMGPPRCRRCRTYINPFMTFVHGGSKFQCNMCLFPNNEVPQEYFSPVDMTGSRMDREQRPELMRGTVEFVVPKEYWVKKDGSLPPADGKGGFPMRYLFLVDATELAVNRGTLAATVAGIHQALYGGSSDEDAVGGEETKRRLPEGCKVGIATFDKEIHFFNLNVSVYRPARLATKELIVNARWCTVSIGSSTDGRDAGY
jgi:protein transport protein SEC24